MGDMFADPDVEIVCIATRSCDRFAHTSAALRAGKDVFVEKPLCTNYDDAKALCELADSLGRHLYVRHNRRFEPAFTHIREIIDSGILGDVFTIKLRRLSYARRDDWQTLKEFGGGQLLNWGPHIIDHALRLLGSPVKSIWSNLKCIAAVGDAEDHVKIVFEGEKGRIVDLEISGGVALGESVYMVWGTRGALSSDEQTIRLRYLNPDVTLSQREANRQTPGTGVYSSADVLDWVEETIPVSPSKPVDLASIWDALWSTVREGAPFPITNDEALQVMQVVSEVKRGSDFENYEGAGE
jgi:predicted dehydrogenase